MIFEDNYKKNTIISQTVVDHNRDMVYSVNVKTLSYSEWWSQKGL